MKHFVPLLGVVLLLMAACSKDDDLAIAETPQPNVPPAAEPALCIGEEQTIGDPSISYLNPEFSDDGRYMVWLEQTTLLGNNDVMTNVWHCAIDPTTGMMIPANGKGFLAYQSSIYKRPNMGFDAQGAYYVGADINGSLMLVRPHSATSGTVTALATPAGPNRRGIFPSVMPGSDKQYVYWFNPDTYPFPADVNTIAVEYIDVAAHTTIHVVATQQNANPGNSWAAMDLAVPRWIDGLPEFTFGIGNPPVGKVQVNLIQVQPDGSFTERTITSDDRNHFDPSPYFFNGARYIMPGDGKNSIVVYKETGADFQVHQTFTVDGNNSSLIDPCNVLSNEPFV
ncbi:MAG: hypothetical protein AAGB22_04210, partial [Bacteroidota bacterium]